MRGSREEENLHHQRRPRHSLTRCSRGKISQYLTPQHSHYRYPYAIPPERQRSMIDLRVTDDYKVNQRRSMAVGPFEDLPPHLRNHLVSVLIPLSGKNSIVFASMCMEICKNHLLSLDSTSGFDQMLALLMFAQYGEKKILHRMSYASLFTQFHH